MKTKMMVVAVMMVAMSGQAMAGKRFRQQCQTGQCYQVQQTYAVQQTQPVQQQTTQHHGSGFVGWLNSVRAQHGLRAVGYDPDLEAWAAVNNQHQASRGIGHFVMGSARRQNSAMGSYSVIGSMWLASPAHASALLDPSISYIGLAGDGQYWTYNAR